MFNLFGKKREDPKRLVCKSNADAFKYACKFLRTDLSSGEPVTAIVLETKDGGATS